MWTKGRLTANLILSYHMKTFLVLVVCLDIQTPIGVESTFSDGQNDAIICGGQLKRFYKATIQRNLQRPA